MGRIYGIYEKFIPASLSLPQRFEVAKRAGYDFVELSVDPSEEKLARISGPKEETRLIRTQAEDAGLRLFSLCVSAYRKFSLGSEDAATVEKGLDISRRAFDFANEVGIKTLLIAGFDVYFEPSTEKTRARFIDNLEKITRIAEKQNLTLAMENVEAEVTSTVERCVKIIDSIHSPNLRLYLDFANMNAIGVDYLAEIPKAKGYIESIHIKDTKFGDIRNVPIGTGTVDFDGAARLLNDMNEEFAYGIELLHDGGARYYEDIVSSLAFVKARF